jgi:DNA-directed RNA polymerase subunit RPC12/RpoP
MVSYKCKKCGKEFTNKTKYTKHKNRKFSCKTADESEEDSKEDELNASQKEPVKNQKEPKVVKDEKIEEKGSEIQCLDCKKEFSLRSSLMRHMKGRCKVLKQRNQEKEDLMAQLLKDREDQKKIIEEQNKKIEEIRKEMESMKENVKSRGTIQQANGIQNADKIQNNNIQNNNTVNQINIIAYGKEDLSHIEDADYRKILNKGFKSIQEYVSYIHFNSKKPENHNMYISNLRDNYILVYDGNSWQVQERDNILQDIVDNKGEMLQLKFNEMVNKLDEPTVRKFRRFLDERDEKEVISKIKKDLKLLLYNKRNVVEDTRNI